MSKRGHAAQVGEGRICAADHRSELWHVTATLERRSTRDARIQPRVLVGHDSILGRRREVDAPVMLRAALRQAGRWTGFQRAPVPRLVLCDGRTTCGGVRLTRHGKGERKTAILEAAGAPRVVLGCSGEPFGKHRDSRDSEYPMPGLVPVLRYSVPNGTVLIASTGEAEYSVQRGPVRRWHARGCRTLESCTPPDRTVQHGTEYSHVLFAPRKAPSNSPGGRGPRRR